jgi:hypothetical protein
MRVEEDEEENAGALPGRAAQQYGARTGTVRGKGGKG